MNLSDILLRLLLVLLLILINAFFVTAEFSIVSVRRSRINQLVESGDIQAQTVQSLQRSIDRLLSTTQLGITLSSLALGWIGEKTMAVLVKQLILFLPLPEILITSLAHSLAIPIAFLLIAYFQIVLGELCPKSLALLYSEKLARFLAPSSVVIARIFNPFIWILNQSTKFLLKLLGIKYTGQGYNRVTPEELQLIITTERESSGLEAEERELLKNVFEFGDVVVEEVMVPRTMIKCIPITATFSELMEEIAATGHSRYPVIGDSIDDIRGIIDFKDLASPLAKGHLFPQTSIKKWLKPARFISESTLLSEILPIMQRSSQKMVAIVDEFGGTSGLVTMQDLVAEIIGDESEDNAREEIPFEIIDEDTFLVQAQMNLEDANELFDLDLPITDEYQTLGGFVMYQFQKIPTEGESFDYDNLELTIVKTEGPRLHQIKIHRHNTSLTDLTEEISVNMENSISTDISETDHNLELTETLSNEHNNGQIKIDN